MKTGKTMAASEFKARCLQVMEDVRRKGEEVIITKRGKPVARLVPIKRTAKSVFGCLEGKYEITGDIVGPIFPDWK